MQNLELPEEKSVSVTVQTVLELCLLELSSTDNSFTLYAHLLQSIDRSCES